MKGKKCRVCGQALFKAPLLRYKNMPKAAQFLPAKADLPREKGVDLDIMQCSGCGLVQLACAPVPYYREVLRAAAFSPEMGDFRRKQFKAFVARYGLKNKKILELGCGKGEYLSLMRAAGAEASGLEYAAASVKACRKAGLDVYKGFVDSGRKLPEAPYSAFCIFSFLEHLPEPGALLAGMAVNLEPGGIGLVEVPDFEMMLERGLFSEFIPDHLFYFTRATLRTMLELNGFELLELNSIWHGYILSAVVRRREISGLPGFSAARESLTVSLNKFISRHGGKVAVWGAGHQALALLSLAGLAGKIKYVVDSAPFKQGKYTPATHIPIVPPSALDQDPVSAVIVMAGSYSGEVAGILKKKYRRGLEIAVLGDEGLEII